MTSSDSLCDCLYAGINQVASQLPDLPRVPVAITRLLMLCGGLISAQLNEALREHGLAESDFRTLMILFSQSGGQASPSELCRFAIEKPTNMTRIADVLVDRGLATRARDETDRRRVMIRITPAGRQFVEAFLPTLFPRVEAAYAGLDHDQRQQLAGLLDRVLENLDPTVPRPELR